MINPKIGGQSGEFFEEFGDRHLLDAIPPELTAGRRQRRRRDGQEHDRQRGSLAVERYGYKIHPKGSKTMHVTVIPTKVITNSGRPSKSIQPMPYVEECVDDRNSVEGGRRGDDDQQRSPARDFQANQGAQTSSASNPSRVGDERVAEDLQTDGSDDDQS